MYSMAGFLCYIGRDALNKQLPLGLRFLYLVSTCSFPCTRLRVQTSYDDLGRRRQGVGCKYVEGVPWPWEVSYVMSADRFSEYRTAGACCVTQPGSCPDFEGSLVAPHR